MSHKEFKLRVAKVYLHAIGITVLAFVIGAIGGPFMFGLAIIGNLLFVAGSIVEFFLDLRHR